MIAWSLTITRLFAALSIPFLIGNYYIMFFYSIIAPLTDMLDGFVARRLGSQSMAGALLDVVADKTFCYSFVFSSYFFLGFDSCLFLSILLIWILRDLILFSLYLFSKKPFKALIFGKIYAAFQFFLVFVVSLSQIFGNYSLINSFLYFSNFIFLSLGVVAIFNYFNYFYKK